MTENPHATFVFADLVGYTALTEIHGDEHAADAAADFFATVRSLLEEYDAVEIKTIGDALLIRVPAAAQAVHFAARVVAEIGTEHATLAVRVGMHSGPAVMRGSDYYGATVNLASRVADQAAASEVVLTEATAREAAPELGDEQLREHGRRTLKNVSEDVMLYVLETDRGTRNPLCVDPVCRMVVDPANCDDAVTWAGIEYHFCSPTCADAFRRAPERYVAGR